MKEPGLSIPVSHGDRGVNYFEKNKWAGFLGRDSQHENVLGTRAAQDRLDLLLQNIGGYILSAAGGDEATDRKLRSRWWVGDKASTHAV